MTPRKRITSLAKRVILRGWRYCIPPFLVRGMLYAAWLRDLSDWLRDAGRHPLFETRYELYEYIYGSEKLEDEILYLEFGVAKGRSIEWWVDRVKCPGARFVGFDTFKGLPEPWGPYRRGSFSTQGGAPSIQDDRCGFEVGLFQETLLPFLEDHALEGRTIVNLDSDLYSSALFVMTALAPRLKKDDIIIMDDLGILREPGAEFRAFRDFCSAYPVRFEVLGSANSYTHVALKYLSDPQS